MYEKCEKACLHLPWLLSQTNTPLKVALSQFLLHFDPKIHEQLKNNPRVDFQIWVNNGGVGEQFLTTVDKIFIF